MLVLNQISSISSILVNSFLQPYKVLCETLTTHGHYVKCLFL